MSISNTVFVAILSVAWIYLRLKDKSQGTGAYAPGQPHSRMSDAIALFGLFWVSLFPISLLAAVLTRMFGGQLFAIIASGIIVISLAYFSFKETRIAPKVPFLDKVRNLGFHIPHGIKGESDVVLYEDKSARR